GPLDPPVPRLPGTIWRLVHIPAALPSRSDNRTQGNIVPKNHPVQPRVGTTPPLPDNSASPLGPSGSKYRGNTELSGPLPRRLGAPHLNFAMCGDLVVSYTSVSSVRPGGACVKA